MLVDLRLIIQQWESIGVFEIILPMLLVFALVFAILQRTKALSGRKGIDAIVAMVISLFAILNPAVSQMFRFVFEKTTIAIVILVACILLIGIVMPKKQGWWKFMSGFIGLGMFMWVLVQIANYYEMSFGVATILSDRWFAENLSWIIALVFIAMFAIIVISSGSKNDQPKANLKEIAKTLFQEEDW